MGGGWVNEGLAGCGSHGAQKVVYPVSVGEPVSSVALFTEAPEPQGLRAGRQPGRERLGRAAKPGAARPQPGPQRSISPFQVAAASP